MKAIEFSVWMEALDRMSRGRRNKLREQLQGRASGDKGVELIEQSLTEQPACPHCAGTELHRWGKSCGLQRYRCCSCKRTFNALVNADLKLIHFFLNCRFKTDTPPLHSHTA